MEQRRHLYRYLRWRPKRCLEVTFYVNGLDLTYANIWQTSFTDPYIKQWLRRFSKERFVCKYDRELACDWMILIAFGLTTIGTVYEMSSTMERHRRQQRTVTKNVTKIYCEVNKSNKVKSRVTLDKTTSLQVKVFSQNSTSLHANYLK